MEEVIARSGSDEAIPKRGNAPPLACNDGLSELPKGWQWTRLGEIGDVIRGISFPKDQRTKISQEGYVACLRTTNVQREVEWDDIWFVPQKFVRGQKQLIRNNDILISTANSLELVGKVAQVKTIPFPAAIGAFISIIRILPNIDPKFICFQISSNEIHALFRQAASTTTNISNISSSTILNSDLRIPPLPEQHRIVAKIEELFTRLDAGVEALNKVKAQLKHYRQAVLRDAFQGKLTQEWREAHKGGLEPASVLLERIKEERQKNAKGRYKEPPPLDKSDLPELPKGWVWTTVGAVADSMKNGIYKPPQFYAETGVACLRMYNIEDGVIVWKDIKRMSLTPDEVREYELRPGDILVNRVNSRELVGKAATIPVGLETCVYESKNIRLRVLSDYVESKYVSLWFQIFSQQYFDRHAQQTVGMASINQQQLGSMPLPLAPTPEQHKIVEEIERRLSVADEIEKTVDHSLKQAERLRQSILKRAFEGKLVPQDPNDEPAEELLERIKEERARQQTEAKNTEGGKEKALDQARLLP